MQNKAEEVLLCIRPSNRGWSVSFLPPLSPPLGHCPPNTPVNAGPCQRPPQRGLRCRITFSIPHYRNPPFPKHSTRSWSRSQDAELVAVVRISIALPTNDLCYYSSTRSCTCSQEAELVAVCITHHGKSYASGGIVVMSGAARPASGWSWCG